MIDIAAQLRAMYLFYHQAHHLSKGMSFFGDHKAFEKFYHELELEYDSVAERLIMMMGSNHLDLKIIMIKAEHTLGLFPNLNGLQMDKQLFGIALTLEKELCGMCGQQIIQSGTTEGTKQLLGDICNESESRQYKLGQRVS